MVDARSASPEDFDVAAQSSANHFWVFAVATVAVGFWAGWFALIPGVVALACGVQSLSATAMAGKLRAGTYPLPNPHNGAMQRERERWRMEGARRLKEQEDREEEQRAEREFQEWVRIQEAKSGEKKKDRTG